MDNRNPPKGWSKPAQADATEDRPNAAKAAEIEPEGYTALIYAAYKGYPLLAQHLLNKGANANIKETMATTRTRWPNITSSAIRANVQRL